MLDDVEKKFVPQLDDPMPGQRTTALEMWREHNLKKDPPRHFRDLVADIDKALPPAEAEELKKKLAAYMKANDAAQKHDAAQKREIAELKAALWVKVNWKTIGAVAAALLVAVTGGWAYERYWSHSDAVMAGLRAAVTSEKWSEGLSEPAARMIGGEHLLAPVPGRYRRLVLQRQPRPPRRNALPASLRNAGGTGLRPVPQAVAAQSSRPDQLARACHELQARAPAESGQMKSGLPSIFRPDAGDIPAPWVPPAPGTARDREITKSPPGPWMPPELPAAPADAAPGAKKYSAR